MIIRAEKPEDYSQIAGITYEAFSSWQERPFRGEPSIVNALRAGQFYDPELSLVAEEEETGHIIGHALFSFLPSILLGEERKGAYLAPLTVAPTHQRQGVGRALLAEGARIAAEKGIAFIILLGHPDYYSKFGYQPNAFSLQGCRVINEAAPDPSITERPVRQSDLPWLTRRWKELHLQDRLAFYPGDLIIQWLNHSPNHVCASVFLRGDEILGYARYAGDTIKDLVPLGRHAAAILRQITNKKEIALPLFAACAAELGLTAQDARATSSAFFMLNVTHDPLVTRYLQEGEPGIVTFPPALDLDE